MKGRPFSYDDLFPDRWLHADDLGGREVTLTITAAYQEDLRLPGGSIDTCGILSFAKTKKEYVLNKSNAMVLVGLWGKESGEWVGHRITIGAVPDESGKSASGYRIVFVGTPDIDAPVKVPQPMGKSRTVKATRVAKGPAHVDPDSGEVMDAPREDTASSAQEAAGGEDTPPEGDDGLDAPADASGEIEELDLALGNVTPLPVASGRVSARQLGQIKALRKEASVNASVYSRIVAECGGDATAEDYGLDHDAAERVISVLRGRVES